MKTKNNFFVLIAFWVATLTASAQGIEKMTMFSASEMETMFTTFSNDKGWSNLKKELGSKKFARIKHDKASWGFKGRLKGGDGKVADVIFCVYDYYNTDSKLGQGASIVWKKVGAKIFKSYIQFPAGVSSMKEAVLGAVVRASDPSGEVVPAPNWGDCFIQCTAGDKSQTVVDVNGVKVEVPSNCAAGCLASVIVCGGATAILAAATSPAAPVSFPTLAIVFGICAGASCAVCLGTCALGCL